MHKENVLSELSVVDISTLVNLIKENKTTTIKGLCLEFLYPDLYRKLDKAYFKKAYSPMVIHRLMKDFQNDSIEYNIYGLMYYCEDNLGFSYEFKPEEYFDEVDLDYYNKHPETYEDEVDEVTCDIFSRWFRNYLKSLSYNEARDFFYDIINEGIVDNYVDYTVSIPSAIIKKAHSINS